MSTISARTGYTRILEGITPDGSPVGVHVSVNCEVFAEGGNSPNPAILTDMLNGIAAAIPGRTPTADDIDKAKREASELGRMADTQGLAGAIRGGF